MNISALGFIQLFNHIYTRSISTYEDLNNTQDRNHKQDLNFIIRKQAPDTIEKQIWNSFRWLQDNNMSCIQNAPGDTK
jgi:hypothetical protein